MTHPLIYLYAYPQTNVQNAKLARYLKQPTLRTEADGVRVVVYHDTPKSLRVLRLREAELLALGIPVQSLRPTPDSGLALARGL